MKESIQTWIDSIQEEMVKEYYSKGLKASGRWEKSLENSVTKTATGYNAKILGEKYTGAMVGGRKKTTNKGDGSLLKAIKQWIIDKPIIPEGKISNDSLAYLITRKIHEKGIKVGPDNPYNDGTFLKFLNEEKIKGLESEIKETYVREWSRV